MAKQQTRFTGHHALEKGKYAEIRKFINRWLTDQVVYCGSCGQPYFPDLPHCCQYQQLGKNIQHCEAVIQANRVTIENNLNEFGSTKGMTWRNGVSMPVNLLNELETFCQATMGQKLFVNQKDLRGFMRAFPMFRTQEKI